METSDDKEIAVNKIAKPAFWFNQNEIGFSDPRLYSPTPRKSKGESVRRG
jgi:hypothetical protein